MNTDLFGQKIEEKTLTPIQKMSIRQSTFMGRDLYTTEPNDIVRFLRAIERDGMKLENPIWEPAAGLGDISKTLIRYGYKVLSSDIYPYKDDEIDVSENDFFLCNKPIGNCKTIFTNPPFNCQEDFLTHALSFGVDVIFFVRLSFLSSIRRWKIYDIYRPSYVYIYTGRAHCYKDGDRTQGQNMIDYCVMIWKPPYKTKPIMEWIP